MARKPSKLKIGHSGKIALLLLIGTIAAMSVMLHQLNTQLEHALNEQAMYAQRLEFLQKTNSALAEDIANSNDPDLIEEIARNDLGWVTQGEKVFRFRN